MKGKFNSDLDEYAYEISLDVAEATIDAGNEGHVDHYSLVRFNAMDWDRIPNVDALDESERSAVAAIVHEDNQGFVTVTYYPTHAAVDAAWAELESQ